MNMTAVSKVLVAFLALGVLALVTSCGLQATQIFNPNFVAESGLSPNNPENQVTPNLPAFLVVKVTNQTNYLATVNVTIKRSVKSETFNVTLDAQQTLGKLIEGCNSADNPVLSVFVPFINGDNTTLGSGITIPLGQAFVTVDGVPVAIPASELPGTLNVSEHFNCGDTIEFVVGTSFSDINRYRISALVYAGTGQ